MIIWPLLLVLVLLVLSVPVAIALIAPSLLYFYLDGALPMGIFAQKMVSSTESFPLLALPFFILAGAIMNAAGITRRLLGLADAFVGHFIGGLAQVSVIMATMMGGLTASANADAAMLSKMLGPTMIKNGYPRGFAAAVVACSSIIVAMIPPSIGLIVYAFMANVSVGRLFIAGIAPGFLIAVGLMISIYFISRRRGFKPVRTRMVSGKELLKAFVDAIWALTIPVFIVVGLRYGIFTPTEAGAIAVFYAVFVGVVCYRELRIGQLPDIIRDSITTISIVMLIICAAAVFGYYMVWEQIPTQIASALIQLTSNPLLLLLCVNLMLLVIGMFLEGTAALILLTPILAPVAASLDIDLVHFGVIMVLNLTLGGVTPPIGTLTFTASSTLRTPVIETFRESIPLLATLLLILALVTLFPQISLTLPALIMP
ncbi:C4-dicarboxylate ABC transporter [Pseudomonas daroniae]|uniref:TRAP transporter large permease protein n=1 Tax=Phytopseudomonas daroniae TaxID=2487519 RepID=A0A4V2KB93_9GAMM|nr:MULTISPECIES: TRAP transporter large permease [Pseudomonas]TBU83468.1 C4-dicarboxylate ABC transporter [Pseudomonas daroniae]TBU85107.1 C4-dicarboxylate ABC transporter [Pseudomonas sp. FRB 228]TBU93600.1 C4-dicarboxylate ABC transporter [Pseudomonas daroniae]